MRGSFGFAAAVAAPAGAVPETVTVTELVKWILFGPPIVNVYVVVAAGFTWRLPLAVTRPTSGSIIGPFGFSVAQTNVTGCPGWMELGCAVKLTMRAGGTTLAGLAGAAGGGVCAGLTADHSRNPVSAIVRRPRLDDPLMANTTI
jgi:hypothetical protein